MIKMSQKKTVFERLEDRMIELQEELNKKLAKFASLPEKLETLEQSVENLKQEIPRSIGQNLLQFSDLIGAKIEDIEDTLNNISSSGGAAPNLTDLAPIQKELKDIKAGLENVQSAVQNIKIELPSTPPAAPKPVSTVPVQSTPPAPASSSQPKAATPAVAIHSQPSPAPSTKPTPQVVTPSSGPMADVFNLLDTIKQKAQSGLSGSQLAGEMEQIRDTIVKVYRWHPALYELATFARRLKKSPEGTTPDVATINLLIEKIEEWKKRIAG